MESKNLIPAIIGLLFSLGGIVLNLVLWILLLEFIHAPISMWIILWVAESAVILGAILGRSIK